MYEEKISADTYYACELVLSRLRRYNHPLGIEIQAYIIQSETRILVLMFLPIELATDTPLLHVIMPTSIML